MAGTMAMLPALWTHVVVALLLATAAMLCVDARASTGAPIGETTHARTHARVCLSVDVCLSAWHLSVCLPVCVCGGGGGGGGVWGGGGGGGRGG